MQGTFEFELSLSEQRRRCLEDVLRQIPVTARTSDAQQMIFSISDEGTTIRVTPHTPVSGFDLDRETRYRARVTGLQYDDNNHHLRVRYMTPLLSADFYFNKALQ